MLRPAGVLALAMTAGALVTAAALSTPVHGAAVVQFGPPRPPASPQPEVIWHVPVRGWGQPATAGDAVYFVSRDHHLLALEAATGRERWRSRLGDDVDVPYGTRIVVAGDVVIAGDYDLFGVDRRSGTLRWRFAPSAGHAPGPFIGAASDGMLYTGSGGGRLHAVDVASGQPAWTVRIDGPGDRTVHAPVVDGDLVIATYSRFVAPRLGGVVAVDKVTGAVRWSAELPVTDDATLDRNAAGGPVVLQDRVLVASADGFIHVFDRDSGATRGVLPRAALERRPHAAASPDRDFRPLIGDGRRLIAASLTGVVSALNVQDATAAWHYAHPLRGSIMETLAVDDATVYVPFLEGTLAALDLESGQERWATAVDLGFHWAPARAGDRLFAAAVSGLYALSATIPEPGARPR